MFTQGKYKWIRPALSLVPRRSGDSGGVSLIVTDANVGGVEARFQNVRARSRPNVWSISSRKGGGHFM